MIDELALAAGIAPSYTDYFGREKRVSGETKRAILAAMGLDAHSDRQAARLARELEAAAPKALLHAGDRSRAYVPPAIEENGTWGFALQLYSLRSRRNWGIGDFGDLARFVRTARELGAGIVGLNPLHQLHLTDPAAASPYSPLSRLHLNVLYVDVDGAFSDLGCAAPRNETADLQRMRQCDLVDYPAVARAKLAALRTLYESFANSQNAAKRNAFRAFRRRGGSELARMAVYEALTAFFKRQDSGAYGWPVWPPEFRDPQSRAVRRFARENSREIRFYEFLQWLAASQLAAAAEPASGMPIGLYRDLAIGVSTASADVWCDRDAYCLGLSVGAPPDPLNTEGQNWGLPPLDPRKLRERECARFVRVLRANMRNAGALRIDHVMGLQRLYLIPDGAPASEGAYVQYPFDDLLTVLTHESRKQRCMIVGEDLGTVPPGFRERMAGARVFSCRLLYFERDADGAFVDPQEYPRDAAASTGTHDLPPLLGYVDALSPAEREAFRRLCGLLPEDGDVEFVSAAYRVLGRTSARVLLVQMEDALLCREPVNVPGTTTEQPNWRRKLPALAETLAQDESFAAVTRAVRQTRAGRERR